MSSQQSIFRQKPRRPVRVPFSALFLVLLYLAGSAVAQSVAARMMGTVTDPSGAIVTNAVVTATNLGTGAAQSARTNRNGQYVLFPLEPGQYDITVAKDGFAGVSLHGLSFDVNDSALRDFRLKVGSSAEVVTVSTSSVPLLTQDISVQNVVTQEQLNALPLNGRDFNQLVLLSAGATDNTVATSVNLDFGSYALNGNRAFSNEYIIDGVPNNNPFQGKSALPLAVDAIGEFKVVSGVPTAEYGHAATAISSITKSGTNGFHGALYEYYRGNQLLANNPFDTVAGNETFLRNQFGGAIGGPVRLPHYDGRNKTFFFFNYEGSRQTDTATRVDTVPTADFWNGDFSSLLSSRKIQLRDPFISSRPAIPGNRLDLYKGGSLMTKTAQALRTFFPSPNLPGLANNLVQFPTESANMDQYTARIDQMLPHSQSLMVRFSYVNTGGFTPNLLGTPGVGLSEPVDSRNGQVTWTAPVRRNMINELRLGGMNYSDIVTYVPGTLPTVSSLGMQGFEQGNLSIPPLPRITFSGNDAFTTIKYGPTNGYGEAALSMTSNIFTIADSLLVTKGRHTFKAGFEGRRDYFNVLQQTNARGALTFSGFASSANSSGYSLADFLIGLPSSSQQVPIKPKALLTENEYAAYGQDSWRLTSRFVLEAGVRYEYSPSPSEVKNRLAMFDGDLPGGGFVVACDNGKLPSDSFLPSVVAKLTDANGNFVFPMVCGSSVGFNAKNLVTTGGKNWAPRVGFAWDPSGKGLYSIHGGYGIVYTRYPVQYFLQTMLVNPPFAGLFPYSQKITSGKAALTLDAPYGGAGGKPSVSPVGINKNFQLPNNQQWNLTVQRKLGADNVVTASYVGNKGSHLFRSYNVNQAEVNSNGVITQPYSTNFGTSSIPVRYSDGNSIYHAMILEFRRRATRDLNLQANWTLAKAIDDVGTNVQTAALDILSPGRDRANSDYARRHSINVNAIYKLPIGRGRAIGSSMPAWADAVTGGWIVSGIWHWTTGRYLTATMTSQGGLSSSRPDVVPGVNPNLPFGQRSRNQWFNPAAFAQPPLLDPATGLPRFGNAGRNTIIGPGTNVADMSLRKTFALGGETCRLSTEMSLFNAFNHPNWGDPDTNISNTNTVGIVSGISKQMRIAQFTVRLDF
ncbi:TonB-dependent receptor [Terriglobus albidus]|uniref:TonB-dependent receptor n=1 Tax=Terriglobus albidus TaxID=1592106 RepID=UPI0021E0BB9D|nr:TonB-dependent receptor [Terriglobus albidus]